MAMSDETPKRYVFTMYCKQNTFMGYHLQVRMYTRCHHNMEKSEMKVLLVEGIYRLSSEEWRMVACLPNDRMLRP
jgi:hypothetical protein